MKKKVLWTAVVFLAVVLAMLLIWYFSGSATANIDGQTVEISYEDSLRLRWLLRMQKTNFHEYACGFSEDYSIKMNGLTYCLAQDQCSSVYIQEWNFYYIIPEENHIQLEKLLAEYVHEGV